MGEGSPAESAYDGTALIAAAKHIQWVTSARLPVSPEQIEKARAIGLDIDAMLLNVRQRLVAGIMDRLSNMLKNASKALREPIEDEMVGHIAILEEPIEVTGVCAMNKKVHVSNTFNKERLKESLLAAGVGVDTIQSAIQAAEGQSRKDIINITWKGNKK